MIDIALAQTDPCNQPVPAGLPQPPKQCKTDGCTAVPDFDFKECCNAHDRVYWQGGSKADRRQADKDFKQCIKDKNHPALARIYYFGVRVGGVPWLPTPWRWGFGWEFGRGYR